MAQKNRWHPVLLPDDYLRKLKQDLGEVEAMVESETRYEPDPESYNVVGLRGPLSDSAHDVPSYPNDDRRCTMLPSVRDTPPPDDVPPSGDLAG
jgi:hypothetical protein